MRRSVGVVQALAGGGSMLATADADLEKLCKLRVLGRSILSKDE